MDLINAKVYQRNIQGIGIASGLGVALFYLLFGEYLAKF